VAEDQLCQVDREPAEVGQGVRGGVQEGAEALVQEVLARREDEEGLPLGVQVLSVGQDPAQQLVE